MYHNNNKLIHIGYSGGGLKGIGHIGFARTIHDYIKPNILSGISVGSIVAMLHALVICRLITWEEISNDFLNLKPKDIFSTKPFSIKFILRGIFFKESLAKQNRLKNLLIKIITKERFIRYKDTPNSPIVYVGYVNYNTATLDIVNIKELHYEGAMECILASSHIPVLTESISVFHNSYCYDGGLIDHCISSYVLEKHKEGINLNINVFSRPKVNHLCKYEWKPTNWFKVLLRTLEISMNHVSRDDDKHIDLLCKLYDVTNHSIYLDNILKNMYDFNKNKLEMLYNNGKIKAFKLLSRLNLV